MAIDFPSSPTIGQVFSSPSGAFSWDGTKWQSVGGPMSGSSYVARAGDTMTGPLALQPAAGWAQFILNKSASGLGNEIDGKSNGVMRWQIVPGNGNAESGVNTGSNFDISRYADAGALIDTPFSINRASGAVLLKGTNTNDSAAAGNIGEWIESDIPYATVAALTTGTSINVTSIILTAGDWDISGSVAFFGGTTTTVSTLRSSLSLTSATISQAPMSGYGVYSSNNNTPFLGGAIAVRAGPMRLSLAATTTIYLVAQAVFGTSTCQTYGGNINARRAR